MRLSKESNTFRVKSQSYETIVKLDSSSFSSYQAACTEAATLAVERFKGLTLGESIIKNIFGVYTVVEELKSKEPKPRFIALTYLVLRNASMHHLSKAFEKLTDQHHKSL